MSIFDRWNILKKNIEEKSIRKRYHAGDVWWCELGQNIGYEQNGKGRNFERPVLVVKGFNKDVCLVVPLTTSIKRNKFHCYVGNFKGKDNFAILSQIRLIDVKRFSNQIGYIQNKDLDKIKKAIWNLIR